jgi:hypothetical protein
VTEPKKKYRSDQEFCADQMHKHIGATITGVAYDPNTNIPALVIEKDGKKTVLWIQSDAECNDGGFIADQEMS